MKQSTHFKAIAISAALFLQPASALAYQSFVSASQTEVESSDTESSLTNFSAAHFFNKKQAFGPLNEFSYINNISNLNFGYQDFESSDQWRVSGEKFINGFLLGGSYSQSSSDNIFAEDIEENQVTLGYLFNENLLVKMDSSESDIDFERHQMISTRYQHDLTGVDYVGFTLVTDDNLSSPYYSAKYFKQLKGGQYLSLFANYMSSGSVNPWSLASRFYINERTSFAYAYSDAVSTDADPSHNISAHHYFSNNYRLSAQYTDNNDLDIYSVSFSAQF